jgi:4-diphosphocytidyl-2C-methyl-D-erythritol kinase
MLCPQPHQGHYLHIGMKNMPGASGLGAGHTDSAATFIGWQQDDEELTKLVELVGVDAAEVYQSLSFI